MKIRGAGLPDIEVLVKYGREFWKHTRYWQIDFVPYSEEHVRELINALLLQQGMGYIVVVEDDEGEVKGFGLVVQTPLIWNRDYKVAGELAFYLDEEVRGSGAGVKLLKTLERIAKHRGIHYMAMISMDHSMDVGPLYEKMGYVRTETTYTKRLTADGI
jgi:GNAT superfamily N-acetyltransferase